MKTSTVSDAALHRWSFVAPVARPARLGRATPGSRLVGDQTPYLAIIATVMTSAVCRGLSRDGPNSEVQIPILHDAPTIAHPKVATRLPDEGSNRLVIYA